MSKDRFPTWGTGPSYCSQVSKPAIPNRYEVERRGTPDPPDCDYYVLDAVHDYQARYTLRFYSRALRLKGNTTRADEIDAGLAASADAHRKAMSANNPAEKTKKTPQRPLPGGTE